MTNATAIFRMIGSVVIGLVLIAAPYLQALQIDRNTAEAEATCGCSCCESEAHEADASDPAGCACGCSMADTEPPPLVPLDVEAPIIVNPDLAEETAAALPTPAAPAQESVEQSLIVFEPGHSPPIYLLHAAYLI